MRTSRVAFERLDETKTMQTHFETITGLKTLAFKANTGSMRPYMTVKLNVADVLAFVDAFYQKPYNKNLNGIDVEYMSSVNREKGIVWFDIRKNNLV